LRLFWSASRNTSAGYGIVPKEAKEAVKSYIKSLGQVCEFPQGTYQRIKITFCQEPEDLVYKGRHFPLHQLERGETEYIQDQFKEVFSAWENPGQHIYEFQNFCSKTMDPRRISNYVKTLAKQAVRSARK